MPSMVLWSCNAKDRACKSGGPHQGNPLGITNCIFAKLRIQFAPFPSFAAGTTDGQGDLNFIQGITKGDILWNSVKGLLGPPSAEQKVPSHHSSPPYKILRSNPYQAEHAPKPILLNTGEYFIPFQWHPVHVDSQVPFVILHNLCFLKSKW